MKPTKTFVSELLDKLFGDEDKIKIKTYIRAGVLKSGKIRLEIDTKPFDELMMSSLDVDYKYVLPNFSFPIDLNIPREAFEKNGKSIAEINIKLEQDKFLAKVVESI